MSSMGESLAKEQARYFIVLLVLSTATFSGLCTYRIVVMFAGERGSSSFVGKYLTNEQETSCSVLSVCCDISVSLHAQK